MAHANQSTLTFSDDNKMQAAVSKVCEMGGFVRYETKPGTITVLSMNGKHSEIVRECNEIENPTPPQPEAEVAPVAENDNGELPPAPTK